MVNVILVDIRGYDTMGEITVLGLAALGGYAVLRSPHLHTLRRKLNRRLQVMVGQTDVRADVASRRQYRSRAMIEIYLRLVDLILTPVMIMLAIMLFLRGHDYPGGGFIAGLTVAAAIELHILAHGAPEVRRQIGRYLLPLVGVGPADRRDGGPARPLWRRLFQRHVDQVLLCAA